MRPSLALAAALSLLIWARPGISAPPDPPSLVLLVVIDQFAAHQLERWAPQMTGGIARLMRSGAVHTQARYAYANTETAPGHATAATGAWPAVHGIVANRWYREDTGKHIYCYQDKTYGHSPKWLQAPTFADALKLATAGQSKTISISLKDRAAIPLGGTRPSLSAWFDRDLGRMVAGRWPGAETPEWFKAEASLRLPAELRGKTWSRLRPDLDYAKFAGPDDHPAEELVPGLGRTFPHKVPVDLPEKELNRIYMGTPWGMERVFQLADVAIDKEKLGRRGTIDLLALGVTSTDYVGHWWGAYSQEQFDSLLRVDRLLGKLMDKLDRELGKDRVLVVVTSDHGALISPEKADMLGVHTGRVDKVIVKAAIDGALKGQAKLLELNAPHIYLGPSAPSVDRLALNRRVAAAVAKVPGVSEAWAMQDVLQFAEPYAALFSRSLFLGRRPAVLLRVQPGYYVSRVDSEGHGQGTGHGSPYVHDMAVPLLIAGPGVRSGTTRRPVNMTRLVPTLAALIGIPPPAAALEPPLPAAGDR